MCGHVDPSTEQAATRIIGELDTSAHMTNVSCLCDLLGLPLVLGSAEYAALEHVQASSGVWYWTVWRWDGQSAEPG